MQTAIVLGATGLVGREIVTTLEADASVERVVVLARRQPDRPVAAKTVVRIVDLRNVASFAADLAGDVLYSALGTTRKAAGSKEAQYEVDYTFQYEVAKAAQAAGVRTYGLVSSLGANAGSFLFYNRMKGELERDVAALGFARTRIVRPSLLAGERAEARTGEKLALGAFKVLEHLPGLARSRPIHVRTVARALVALCGPGGSKGAEPLRIVESHDLFALGQ